MSFIEKILKTSGPMLSSQIINRMVEFDNISKEAARKRLSRATTPVRKLKGINFSNNEKFIYLDDHFGKTQFIESLHLALVKNNTAAGRALNGLGSRDGAIPKYLFSKLAGLTVHNTKGQLLAQKVLDQLYANSLIHTFDDYEYGEVILDHDCAGFSNHHRAILKAESIILPAIRSWIVNIGLSSTKAIKIRDVQMPQVGPFCWDITGPCYIHGLSKYTKDNKREASFIVADILLGKEITVKDLEPFMFKIDFLSYQKSMKPFMPLLVADYYDIMALQKLRGKGVLLGRPESIFGVEAAKSLRELVKTLTNAAEAVTKNPEKISDLFERLLKIEGAALNLRSVVLEFIVAHIYALEGYGISMRKVIRTEDGELAEIDVLAKKENHEVICIECKAKSEKNLVTREEVEEWINRPLRRIKQWLKENVDFYRGKRKFIFCTSTDYDSDATHYINHLQKTYKKFPITFLKGIDLLKMLNHYGQHGYINILKEHFIQK